MQKKYRSGRIKEEMPYGKWIPYKEYEKLPLEKRLIKLSKTQEERASELYEKNIIIDMDGNCLGDLLGAPGAGERAKSVGITYMWDTFSNPH